MPKKPAFKYRGVMLDFARLPERHDYYLQLLPHLKAWGYNMVHVHFTDDQGCALKFPSHPELATAHAYTPDEMREFCASSRRYGLEVVPEIECFGHTDFITRLAKYKHLREIGEGAGQFSGMCVFEQESKAILRDILKDTVEIFKPRLLHAGLDEVNFGYHPTSRRLLKKKKANRLFAEHIQWCHREITRLGCRMAIWGDHLLHDKEDGVIADGTPKDTVIFDWHYNHDYEPSTMDFFIDRGFEVYGAPATQRYRNQVISSWENFQNLQRFSAFALPRRKSSGKKGRVTGMVNTVWCPYRYVAGTIEYPLAVAGELFTSEGLLPEDFAVKFVRDFWGFKGEEAEALGRAVEALHGMSPVNDEYERIVFGCMLRRRSDVFSRADEHLCRERLAVVKNLEVTIRSAVKVVSRNKERLEDLLVAAEYLRKLYAYGYSGRKRDPGWKALQASMRKAWARSRYCDGPGYSGKSGRFPMRGGDRDAVMRHVNRLAGG